MARATRRRRRRVPGDAVPGAGLAGVRRAGGGGGGAGERRRGVTGDVGRAAHRGGRARVGPEITPGTFPPEVGFVAAVSYDKGCFMGQEPLARIHARGQVNRVLVRVHAGTCPEGPVELAAPERPQAGLAATWAPDPSGGASGLAIVHRSAASPGTVLSAAGIGAVEVRSGPLGDDPGVKGRK
ncbi:hypothetical protein [Nannocystis pusilla]|uniref:CAF17-like 4Fe-4S cluster assembly/insertion protein YgfZ n=1 Tax=Nannocystis pusilla TaxID=889268 RepID=UPI003B77F583